MKKPVLYIVAVGLLLLGDGPGAAQESWGGAAPALPEIRAVLDQYCVTCHNSRLRTADLALDAIDLARVDRHAETLEKVAAKLRAREMPPAARPRFRREKLTHSFPLSSWAKDTTQKNS